MDGTPNRERASTAEGGFSRAVAWTIQAEGGGQLVHDAGGATRWGIAQKYNPDVDVENLTRERAEAIYRERYWLPVRAEELPAPLAFILFEFAVNPGLGAATKTLQRAVGVKVDGVFGLKTLHATLAAQPPELCAALLKARGDYYAAQAKKYPWKLKYLHGWLMRNYRLALEAGRWLEERS